MVTTRILIKQIQDLFYILGLFCVFQEGKKTRRSSLFLCVAAVTHLQWVLWLNYKLGGWLILDCTFKCTIFVCNQVGAYSAALVKLISVYYFGSSTILVLKILVHLFGKVFPLYLFVIIWNSPKGSLWDHSCLVCNHLETYLVDSGIEFRSRGRTSHWGNHVKILVLLLI